MKKHPRDYKSFLTGLLDKVRRRDQQGQSFPCSPNEEWWRNPTVLSRALEEAAILIADDFGVRFPLDLVIKGAPDTEPFRTTSELISTFPGDISRKELVAPVGGRLVLHDISLTPDLGFLGTQTDSVITTFINDKSKAFSQIEGSKSTIQPICYPGYQILNDGDTFRIDLNTTGLEAGWFIDINGWVAF